MRTVEVEQVEKRIVDALAMDDPVSGQIALAALLYVTASLIFNCYYEDREDVARKFGAALADLAGVEKRPLQ